MVKDLGEIPIQVQLNSPFAMYRDSTRSEYMELHEYIIEFVGGLISELGIPFRLSLGIEVTDDKDLQPASPFRPYLVYINGNKCRYPPDGVPSSSCTPFEIAVSIAHVIYQNREFLVTPDVSKKIFTDWCQKDESGVMVNWIAQDFQTLLTETVRKGISFFWIESAISSGILEEGEAGKPLTPEILFEKTIFTKDVIIIGVLLPEGLYKRFIHENPEQDQVKGTISSILSLIQDALFQEYGIHLPQIKLSVDTSLDGGWLRIQINNLRFPPTRIITQDQQCVNITGDQISPFRIPFIPIRNPMGQEYCIIPNTAEFGAICKANDLVTYDQEEWIGVLISGFVRNNLPAFLPRDIVEFQLRQLDQVFSHLVETFLRFFTIHQLTSILRELLAEKISIRNLWHILEILLELRTLRSDYSISQISTSIWTQLLRQALRVQITSQLVTKENKLIPWLLDPNWEKKIQLFEPLPDHLLDFLNEAIRVQLGPSTQFPVPVFLSNESVRSRLWSAIKRDFPNISVMSYGEIWETIDVIPIGQIKYIE